MARKPLTPDEQIDARLAEQAERDRQDAELSLPVLGQIAEHVAALSTHMAEIERLSGRVVSPSARRALTQMQNWSRASLGVIGVSEKAVADLIRQCETTIAPPTADAAPTPDAG